jgi:hypothetical protein
MTTQRARPAIKWVEYQSDYWHELVAHGWITAEVCCGKAKMIRPEGEG